MRRTAAFLIALIITIPALAEEQVATPELLWTALLAGNKQFVAGEIKYDKLKAERDQFDEHQFPPMTVLSCSDSRVPPELLFNQSLGTLFVIREAGSVADTFGLASIEYAITQGYTSLIVVLGHQNCGAVRASLSGADPDSPHLLALAQRIRMSFVGVKWDASSPEAVKKAVEANTRASAVALLAQSKIIRDAAMTGKLKIVTAYYDMETGEVKTLE
jgi:carbonic anhydrase